MEETIKDIVSIVVLVIGSSTLVFQGLLALSTLTKSEKDDNFFRKVLVVLTKVAEILSINRK